MQLKYVVTGLAFIILATLCGLLLAIWVFKHFNIYIPLEDQSVSIDLQEPLQAKVQIHDALDVDVTGRVNALIPIKENLNVPLTQTLTPRVYFDSQVPIKTTIPVRETLIVNQDMPVDTKVKVKVLGKDITLPLKGVIPIKLNVPIHMDVPLEQNIHLKFNAPVKAVLKENLHIPLDTTLKTNIPIQGHLNVPIKTALNATVDVQNTLPVKIKKGDLVIPLNRLQLKREEKKVDSKFEPKKSNSTANSDQIAEEKILKGEHAGQVE